MGARSHSVYTFLAGRLPAKCGYIRRALSDLRAALTTELENRQGSVSVSQAGLISAACRHEGRALLLAKWMRDATDLPLAERVAMLADISAATDSRNKAIQRLGLETQQDGHHEDLSVWKQYEDPADEITPQAQS